MCKILLKRNFFKNKCKFLSKKFFFGLPIKNKRGRMKIHSSYCICFKNFISRKRRIYKTIFCNFISNQIILSDIINMFTTLSFSNSYAVLATNVETKRTKLKRELREKENENKKYDGFVVEKRKL